MKLHRIFLACLFPALASCKTLLIKAMLKDPTVETAATVRNFQESNGFSTQNSFIQKADTATALWTMLQGMAAGYHVFDAKGRQLCYNGHDKCSGTQFQDLMQGELDSFRFCTPDTLHLQKIHASLYTYDRKPAHLDQFPASDYYVVAYWQKFMGGRRAYREGVAWMEEEIAKDSSGRRITFLKVNTDLQDTWGLEPGKKVKTLVKREGGSLSLDFGELPVKK